MPSKPKRSCRQAGCPALVDGGGYCPQHLSQRRSQYDRERRPKDRQRLYDTAAWDRTRKAKLSQNPICQDCGKELATDVDHIQTVEVRPDLSLSMENLRSLCHSCHSRRTATDNKAKGVW